jgi:hypothetical protein
MVWWSNQYMTLSEWRCTIVYSLQPFRPSMRSSWSGLYRLYHSIDCVEMCTIVHRSSSVEPSWTCWTDQLTKAKMLRCFELLMLLPQLLVSLHKLCCTISQVRRFWSPAKLRPLATSHDSTLLMLQVCWFKCREKNNVSAFRKKGQLNRCLQCLHSPYIVRTCPYIVLTLLRAAGRSSTHSIIWHLPESE